MKRISMLLAIILIVAGLSACGSKPGTAPVGSTPPAEAVSPTDEVTTEPMDTAPAETGGSGETAAPEQTPWPEPSSVAYQGSYLDIAQDKDASKYPSLKADKEVQINLIEMAITFKIPSKWRIDDPDGTPTLVDDKGRIVGQIYQVNAYLSDPYFSLTPLTGGTPISWEAPTQYKQGARALTLESDTPTAQTGQKKTIIKVVALMSGEPYNDEDGKEFYLALCLSFDKAYVNGGNTEYVLSNQTIDEIVASFAEGLNLEE